jgi:hypothetical protein
MPGRVAPIDVYFEVGSTRTFAGAIDWPGWARSGRDEAAALDALLAYGPRYARVLRRTRLGFAAPADVTVLRVAERLKGTPTTDFGAPDVATASDRKAVREADLRRFHAILRACWRAFDAAVDAAEGKTLAKGPRGGGRSLDAIVEHVVGAEGGYLGALGWKLDRAGPEDLLTGTRAAVLEGLGAAARGEVPARGPRGGRRWTPRYFVRRAAWHVLDHAWEVEDRAG